MKALLLAAGRQQRWVDNGGEGYKQLLEVAGEPIVRRTFRLASKRCEVVTLVDDPHLRIWDGLNPRKPAHEPWMGEMGKFLDGRPYWPTSGEVVIVYGDVFYTEACLTTIFAGRVDQPTIYGRAQTGSAESFAIRFDVERDADEVERIAKACADADLNKRGGPWRWFFFRHTGETNYQVDRVREMATRENGWIETPHDATDDFDTPDQFASWLRKHEPRRQIMPRKKATKRIYGVDRHGRTVLVAAPGQSIPEGFTEPAPPVDHAMPKPEPIGELDQLTVVQLRELAKRRGIDHAGLRKADLIEALAA